MSQNEKTEKTKQNKEVYGAKSIQVLHGLEPVRKRPGMYIGGTSLEGLHHLVWEVVNNSIDEAMAGFCDDIKIRLLPDNIVEVTDNGRGIPVEKHHQTKKSALETVMTVLHAGGKFGGEGYKVSGGLHGVGVSVVNALSVWTKVEVRRDGKIWIQEYKRGKALGAVKPVGKAKTTGTMVTFQPDPEIFPEIKFNWDNILDYLRQQAYLTKGVKITLEDYREIEKKEDEFKARKHGFYFDGGIASFVKFLNKGKEVKNEMPVYIEKMVDDIYAEVSLQYTGGFKEHLFSFANNIYTVEGGMHVTGFKTALTRILNDYAKKNNLIKEKEGSLNSDDVREGLTAVISVKLRDPQFEGQTKAKLGSSEVRGVVASVTAEGLSEYLETHPKNARAIIDKCLLTARARIAARAAKDAVIRKGALEGMTLPGKLADCSTRDPSLSEVYIVEGDSAGGCWDGNTKVALVDGRNISFKELLKEDKTGKRNFCYTMQNNGHIGIAPILNPRRTKRNAEVVKIILDNGDELICTPDHLFRLTDGSYVPAHKLTPQHNLAPLYKKLSKKEGRRTLDGYEMVFDQKSKKWAYTHILSDMFNLKNKIYRVSMGKHRHHQDFNKLNNNPTNIERVSYDKHMSIHYSHLEHTLHRPDVKIKSAQAKQTDLFRGRARLKSLEKRDLFSANAKKQWQNEEYKNFMTQKFLEFYAANSEYREKNNKLLNKVQREYWSDSENRRKQSEKTEEYYKKHPEQKQLLSEISKKEWKNKDLLVWRSEETKKQWTEEFREKRKRAYNETYLQKGLKLMKSVYEKCNDIRDDVYDAERRKINDRSIIKISTICERFFNGDRKKMEEAAINFNHKIKSIKKLKRKIDVYDIEVPETHNFALSSGVFVHNSAKQGRNRQFQAILPLRGKLVNVEKTSLDKVVKSDTLKPIIIALGTGIGENFDIKRLRYHKIIIMADADVDGSHIRTLLLTFFYRYFEDLITGGHIYIAQPPLYRIQKGREVKYAYSENNKNAVIEEMKKQSLEIKSKGKKTEEVAGEEKMPKINIQRYKGLGEMNPEQLWETTMNPENRFMYQVKIENAEEADRMFDILMGTDVEPRRRFIQTHAKSVKNLDV